MMEISIPDETPSTVLLVEDEPAVQAEIVELIQSDERFRIWDAVGSFADALPRLYGRYDLLVADKALPDGCGFDLIRMLNNRPHNKRSMVMSIYDDETSVMDAFAAGADGYFVKQDPHILDAMSAVLERGNPISPSVTKYFLKRYVHDDVADVDNTISLRPREIQTLQALAEGKKYHEIASTMGVSKHTVPDYIKSLYRKLGVHDRSSAVYTGLKHGLIQMQ